MDGEELDLFAAYHLCERATPSKKISKPPEKKHGPHRLVRSACGNLGKIESVLEHTIGRSTSRRLRKETTTAPKGICT